HRLFVEQFQAFRNCPFELCIAPFYKLRRRIFNLYVRSNTNVFNVPFPFQIVKSKDRSGDSASVYRWRSSKRSNQAAPRACSDQRTQLSKFEIVWKCVSTRPRGLVDEHHFGTVNSRYRREESIPITKSEKAHRFPVKFINDKIRHHSALIVPFVNDGAFLILLRIKVTNKRGITRTTRVGKPYVG